MSNPYKFPEEFNLTKYEITRDGRIYNHHINGFLRRNVNSHRIKVKHDNDIKRTDYEVGFLVAKAYLTNPNNYQYIKYIDGDNKNYKLDNLEWVEIREKKIKKK